MFVSEKQLKKETNRAGDIKTDDAEKTFTSEVKEAPEENPVIKNITEGNILGSSQNLEKRKAMISAKGFEPAEFAYERAIGKNDSLYSNFTELIAVTKRKIGRIVIKSDNKIEGYATGFMVSDSLLLTNWHVFKKQTDAEESEVQFFYEYDVHGHPVSPVIFKLKSGKYFANKALDYCFIAVEPFDITGKVPLSSIGYLYLDKALGKIGEKNVEKLNIIHHPQGDYKQISIRENTFIDIDATKIFYITDTAQGSSGSPVLNDQWQVVGLHHKSIAKMTPDEKNYLDAQDNIIPVIDDKIDVTKVVWLRNEGIRISVILNHIAKEYPGEELLKKIEVPPLSENLNFAVNAADSSAKNLNNNNMSNSNNDNININVPVSALKTDSSIEISLSAKTLRQSQSRILESTGNDKELADSFLEEVAKADKEKAADFSKCKGYDPDFLGVDIPLPKPKKKIEKQIAQLKNKTSELKYFKYSVIFNSAKRMPALSAVNVEGDPDKRLDNSKRKDDWLRDVRIDTESQLFDKFYAKSGFAKGHMSRFEDANWDNTEKEAYRNGIFTCFYTNACPQVADLNGAGGDWGKLEKVVLEKGVKKEEGKLARVTVFNGPIFDDEIDRVFKGVTIPMQFFKIVLWLDDNKKLKATAFKLTQELLVGDVEFDESMRIAEEAIDIDKNVVFKKFQLSIKKLAGLINFDLKYLEKYDTFTAGAGDEEVLITNDEAIMV
ncbi:MAG: hypothetical protein HOP31_00440 [Ignavibacteria bacterium]|nr:hypothetical protein [Ignavibacteria bacterium]